MVGKTGVFTGICDKGTKIAYTVSARELLTDFFEKTSGAFGMAFAYRGSKQRACQLKKPARKPALIVGGRSRENAGEQPWSARAKWPKKRLRVMLAHWHEDCNPHMA